MRRTLAGVAFFAAGLGIAFGGAQLVAGSGGDPLSAAAVAPVSSVVTTTTTTTTSAAPAPAAASLADVIRPLDSALPEIALDGFGEPLGFQPLGLSLPAINVTDANINPVGVEANGELELPSTVDVGWYEFGAGVDGGEGSTVLAAHIAYNGVDGVFRRLDEIQTSDIVFVDVDGKTIEYRVINVRLYDKQALPFDDIFREDGEEQLVLITCGGSFNPDLRSYESNVVVTAIPV